MLQGCLVAALPVVAASAMATRDAVNESQRDMAGAVPNGEVRVDARAAIPPSDAGGDLAKPVAMDPASEAGWRVSELTELPAPSAGGNGANIDRASAFSSFATYALVQAQLEPGSAQSALLANPGALDGERKACGKAPPAVLVDLDPWSGLIDVDRVVTTEPELAAKFEELRRQDITIGWISGRLAIDAERIRVRLARSGLDPLGQDSLLLLQSLDESKQQKRAAFGRDYCLLAIAGDIESDFDELFDYLKNQDMALRLSGLRNAGWFITPLPLATAPLTEE